MLVQGTLLPTSRFDNTFPVQPGMSLSSDGLRFPSKGFVRLPTGGNLEWECSRKFAADDDAFSQLQGLPILTEFLQKQDEAMSLFIEGIVKARQKIIVPDITDTYHNSANRRGTSNETVKLDFLQPAHQKEVRSTGNANVQDVNLTIADEKAGLEDAMHGVRIAHSAANLGLDQKTVHGLERLEKWSDWWVNLREPDRYSTLAKILGSPWSNTVIMVLILINTILIAFEADYEMQSLNQTPHDWFIIAEWSFLCFYSLEILCRIYIHGIFYFINDDWAWNTFDLIIVFISAVGLIHNASGDKEGNSIGFLRIFRVLRSVKVVRVFRAFRMFRDLRIMLECIYGSFVSLFWCCCLLLLIILIFAIFYLQTLGNYLVNDYQYHGDSTQKDQIQKNFGTLPRAVLTLYKVVFGMVDAEMIFEILKPTGLTNVLVLCVLVGFYNLALITILTGIFAEKATQSAKPDKEVEIMEQKLDNIERVDAFRNLFRGLDLSQLGVIERDDFITCFRESHVKFSFQVEDLPINDAQAFFDLLQSMGDADAVDIDTFVASCLRLRGHASAVDLHYLELKVMKAIEEIGTQLEAVTRPYSPQQDQERSLRHIEAAIERLETKTPQSLMALPTFSTPPLHHTRGWV